MISKEDVTLLLSHAPIDKPGSVVRSEGQFTQSGGGTEDYLDRAESQKELIRLVDLCFAEKPKLNFEDFKRVSETVSSEMFLCMFSLLKTHFPSIVQFKRYEQGLNRKSEDAMLRSPSSSKKLASPKILSKFSPVTQMVKFATPKPEHHVLRVTRKMYTPTKEETKAASPSRFALPTKLRSSLAPPRGDEESGSPISPAVRQVALKVNEALFCECGKEINDTDKLLCDDCIEKMEESKCEGYLSKMGKDGQIKESWVCIEKRELFCIPSTYKQGRLRVAGGEIA